MLKVLYKNMCVSIQCSAGDDGDSALVELVNPLSLLDGQLHREQQVLPGAVQVDREHDLGSVRD